MASADQKGPTGGERAGREAYRVSWGQGPV